MGKYVAAGLLAFLGLGTIGQYPIVGFGFLAAGGLLVWMGLQSRQAARVGRSRPVAARQARMDVQAEVNRAQRAANRQLRAEVERARRRAQRNLASAVERVARDQSQRWM